LGISGKISQLLVYLFEEEKKIQPLPTTALSYFLLGWI